ncbi:MAG: xanthine phosphoribosyltransferase [Lachnospiraceae bacterium]|nr:xanthine phosphoribosyltransferase [Lachnospiraceae bacterium]
MKLLEERIRKDGVVKPPDILKVDSFLNHQIDPILIREMGREFKRLFEGEGITKVITVEASGIAIAIEAAAEMGVPLVFAKKSRSRNIANDVWTAKVFSFTHGNTNDIVISKQYLSQGDRVLIIDDFLANGEAVRGLVSLCEQAGAEVKGVGIAIEKGFQPGGKELREKGFRIESLAIIESMNGETGEIVFRS